MLVPSKFTKLEESTIFKMRVILIKGRQGENVTQLFGHTKKDFQDASEFLSALNILFFLGYLSVRDDGVIEYA